MGGSLEFQVGSFKRRGRGEALNLQLEIRRKKDLPPNRKGREGTQRGKWVRGYLLWVIGKEAKEAASSSYHSKSNIKNLTFHPPNNLSQITSNSTLLTPQRLPHTANDKDARRGSFRR
jgi:hypothetical protein